MAQTTTASTSTPMTRQRALAELQRLRDEIAHDNPDMSDEDWDAFADRWAADINAGLAARVLKGRGDSSHSPE